MVLYNADNEAIELLEPTESNWKGKKIIFDGTSLTHPAFALASDICSKLGAVADNHHNDGKQTFYNFRARFQDYASDADAIVIELDGNGTPNGVIEDITTSTWLGTANLALNCLRESFPTIPIFLISDWGTRGSVSVNGGKRMVLLSECVHQLCAYHGCIHIDCSAESQFNMVNAKSRNAFSNTGSDDHQKKELAIKYLYPFIAKKIDEYVPLDELSETGITIDNTSISVKVGEIVNVHATVSPDKTVWNTNHWSSADTSIATACGGEIRGESVGNTTVTVKTKHGFTAICNVTVIS